MTNTSSGWKVLLFSVALDTHLLSVPDLISPRLGHGPFSASEPNGFFSDTWSRHSAENCLSEIKQKERWRGYGLAQADIASLSTRLAWAVWREVSRNEERGRGGKRENPFSSSFLLRLWSCSLISVSCVHSVIRRWKEKKKKKNIKLTGKEKCRMRWWLTCYYYVRPVGAEVGKSSCNLFHHLKKSTFALPNLLINIDRYTMTHIYSAYTKHKASSFWLRCLPYFSK